MDEHRGDPGPPEEIFELGAMPADDSGNGRRGGGSTDRRFLVMALAALTLTIGVIAGLAISMRSQNGTYNRGPVDDAAPDAPDPGGLPRPVGLGAPTDGKASMRLPVRVAPDHDLVDGQRVTVIGSGFRPRTTVGAVMCTDRAQTQGINACDMTVIGITAPVLADGTFSLQYTIRQRPLIGGLPFDCRNGNVDPARYEEAVRTNTLPSPPDLDATTCIIAVGQIDDYDVSGGWPIAIKGATFLPADHVPNTATTVATAPVGEPSDTGSTVLSPELPPGMVTSTITPGASSPTTSAAPAPGGTATAATRPTTPTTGPSITGPPLTDLPVTTTAPPRGS